MKRAPLVLTILLGVGCGGFGPSTVTRTVGGQAREGIFVSPYSYEHFIRAELANDRGALEEARQHYRLARAGPEDDPLLIARLADVTDRLGSEAEALALLEQGAQLDPAAEVIWLTRGLIHERHERADEAVDAYARAISSAPVSERGPLALARLLREEGQRDEADAVLERYLERARGAGAARARLAIAVERGDGPSAAEAVRSLLSAAPARADEVRAAVRTAVEDGHPELGLRLLAALPDDAEDRPLRLRTAIAARDHREAEAILVRWMPGSSDELTQVAEGYLAIGQPERALELAQVALGSDGGATATLTLGRALRALGRHGAAARVLATVEPGSQAWPAAPIELARALRDAGSPGLASEVLSAASARRDSLALRVALADARAEAGDEPGALAALAGDDPQVRANRAELLERFGRANDSVAVYAALSVDDARLSERQRARALAESRRGRDLEGAIAGLRAWTERDPSDMSSRVRLAELLAEAGQREAATQLAERNRALVWQPWLRARLDALPR